MGSLSQLLPSPNITASAGMAANTMADMASAGTVANMTEGMASADIVANMTEVIGKVDTTAIHTAAVTIVIEVFGMHFV